MKAKNSHSHYPNLTAYRGMAAFTVFLGHFYALAYSYKAGKFAENFAPNPNTSTLGVLFFFVLSAFLLSSQWLQEGGKASAGRFYARRAARVLPVYAMAVFLAFFLFPKYAFFYDRIYEGVPIPGVKSLAAHLLMLSWLFAEPFAGHLWSVSVEFWFYLFLPILMRLGRFAIPIILAVTSSCIGLQTWIQPAVELSKPLFLLKISLPYFHAYAFAAGILAAFLAERKPEWLGHLFGKPVQFFFLGVTVLLWASGWDSPPFTFILFSFLFSVLILNGALNPLASFRVTWPAAEWFGRLSYSFYAFHTVLTKLSLDVCHLLLPEQTPAGIMFAASLVVGFSASLAAASASFYAIERPATLLFKRFYP